MDKDYKDRIPGQSNGAHHGPPGWLWFATGVLAGGFFAGLICLKSGGLSPSAAVVATEAPPPKVAPKPQAEKPQTAEKAPEDAAAKGEEKTAAAAEKPAKKPPPAAPEPRFDFYTILPEKEEVVANERKAANTRVPRKPVSPPLSAETPFRQGEPPKEGEPRYMLQLGSFKRLEDAERRRAELAMMTIPAEIQTVTINDGEVYHRVRSGPYSSEDAGLLGDKLSAMEINSLTIRLRDQESQ